MTTIIEYETAIESASVSTGISKGLFKPASQALLSILKSKNENKELTFLLPTKFISKESASVGFLFNHLLNRRTPSPTLYKSFFSGCHLDAVSGVIKIIRHNNWKNRQSRQGDVLIYDKSQELSLFFNPLNVEGNKKLVPGVDFVSTLEEAKEALQTHQWIGFLIRYDGTDSLEEIEQLFAFCKKQNILIAFDESLLENWYEEHFQEVFSSTPDIYVFGENMTNREVPFGGFAMSKQVYKPWNNIPNCLTHSSSYTGNTIALSMILALFDFHGMTKEFHLPSTYSRKEKYQAYANYINPTIAWIFYVTGLCPEVKEGYGSHLRVEMDNTEQVILDGVAGSGCCLRGHNPQDLIKEILEIHDTSYDYWNDLAKKISELTNLPHAFPSVSGSSSVDIAIILALLANPTRTRIITFKHNYSGKSLISLNVTRYEHFREPFHPLYFDVLEIDPFASDAERILKKELCSGNIALIWFEFIQGQNLDQIPEQIIQIVNDHQEVGGYLVGVDEILTGFFRTGEFLASQGKVLSPDLIALAKGISDMTFPMAAVFTSDRLHKAAKANNPAIVAKLEKQFISQIGSHIALHGLERALEANIKAHVKEMKDLFVNTLKDVVSCSPLCHEIRGEGLLLYVKLNKKAFPVNLLGEEFIEFLMSNLYLNKGKILFLNSRLTPSLGIQREEMEELCRRLGSVLGQTNRFFFFLSCLRQIAQIHLLCAWQKIKESLLN